MKKNKEKKAPLLDGSEKPIFSDRKNVLRLIGFLIAFTIAVSAITIGVVQIGKKDPGLYVVETDADGNLPFYASGIRLQYDFTGSSSEIKTKMNAVKAAYSTALKRSYQWFDAKNTYPESPNLASISQNAGQAVKLQEPFFRILQDALEKTERGEGYTIFAAPLISFGTGILYATDPASVDPLVIAENAALLQEMERIIREDPGELILNEAELTATLNLSAAYASFLEEYEMTEGVLHLGTLADAYRLQYVAQALEESGFTKGFLTTDSGISLLLSGYTNEQAKYCLYSLSQEGKVEVSATKTATAASASCNFRIFAFSQDELSFYTVKNGEQTVYRNPYQIAFQQEQPVLSVLATDQSGNVVEATYTCICLMTATDAETALAFAKRATVSWIVDLNDGEADLYLSDTANVQTLETYQKILNEN